MVRFRCATLLRGSLGCGISATALPCFCKHLPKGSLETRKHEEKDAAYDAASLAWCGSSCKATCASDASSIHNTHRIKVWEPQTQAVHGGNERHNLAIHLSRLHLHGLIRHSRRLAGGRHLNLQLAASATTASTSHVGTQTMAKVRCFTSAQAS